MVINRAAFGLTFQIILRMLIYIFLTVFEKDKAMKGIKIE